MDTDARGQLGGMDASEEVRKRLAGQSRSWKCGMCGKTNATIMREQDEAVKEHGGELKKEVVPEELRLAYREDLSQANGNATDKAAAETNGLFPEQSRDSAVPSNPQPAARTPMSEPQLPPASRPRPAQLPQQQLQQQQRRQDEGIPPWIDKAIYGILAALVYLLWKKIA